MQPPRPTEARDIGAAPLPRPPSPCSGCARMKATFDVHVGHPEVYPVQVQGPKSKDVMRDLFDDRIPDIPYYRCEQTDLDSIPIVISRLG
jgi:glycine cleavage system aminomethyltransferase T